MKFLPMIAAGLVAMTGLVPAAASAAPVPVTALIAGAPAPMLQDRVVRQRTVVRRTVRRTRGYGVRTRRPYIRQRQVCRTTYRYGRRVRTCRTIRR